MKPELEAVLRDVRVVSEYRGTVYERTAVLETDEITMEVYDDHNVVSEEMIGQQFSFVVRALTSVDGIEDIDKAEKKISPPTEQISEWSYDFCGEIIDKGAWLDGATDEFLLLDVGVGTVLLVPSKEALDTLNEGDYLCTTATRTEIIGVS